MKTQFRDPDGILNALQNVIASKSDNIFFLLLEACEAFDVCMIRRNSALRPDQKTTLMEMATTPLTLMRQVRLYLRRKLGRDLMDVVSDFELPKTLSKYLLFDYMWGGWIFSFVFSVIWIVISCRRNPVLVILLGLKCCTLLEVRLLESLTTPLISNLLIH